MNFRFSEPKGTWGICSVKTEWFQNPVQKNHAEFEFLSSLSEQNIFTVEFFQSGIHRTYRVKAMSGLVKRVKAERLSISVRKRVRSPIDVRKRVRSPIGVHKRGKTSDAGETVIDRRIKMYRYLNIYSLR